MPRPSFAPCHVIDLPAIARGRAVDVGCPSLRRSKHGGQPNAKDAGHPEGFGAAARRRDRVGIRARPRSATWPGGAGRCACSRHGEPREEDGVTAPTDSTPALAAVEAQRILELEQRSIRIPSPTFEERAIADFYANTMSDIGL